MGTQIFDIDGTIVNYHTNDWIVGAKELIIKLFHEGNQIILITMRDEIRDKGEIWSVENTKTTILKDLDESGIKYIILFGISSPRTLHDDSLITVDRRRTNQIYDGRTILLANKKEYVHYWFTAEGIDWSQYDLNNKI
jgi:hypothetical protein